MSGTAPQVAPSHEMESVAAPTHHLRQLGRTLARITGLLTLDATLLGAGLVAAFGLRLLASPLYLGSLTISVAALNLYALCGLCWLAMFFYENLYRLDLQSADQSARLTKALTAGIILAIVLSFLVHRTTIVSRGVLISWYLANLLLFALIRPGLRRMVLRLLPAAQILVASEPGANHLPVCEALQRLGFEPCLVPLHHPHTLDRLAHTAAVLCLGAADRAGPLLAAWEANFPEICIFDRATAVSPLGSRSINLHGVQLYSLHHPLAQPLNRACKRLVDIAGSATLLLLASPLLLAMAVAVRLDSPGPVLFHHRRQGRNGRTFHILKFRTMVQDAEHRLQTLLREDENARQEFTASFKLKRDPRLTRLGTMLRRYSLDELPQLWNVLLGDMSLVGPRPIVEAEVPMYGDAYSIVASVRPGMTGIWQISGRSDISYESRRGFDVAYVRDWSLWQDFAILLRTVAAVVLPNAY